MMINRDDSAPMWRTSSHNNAACVEVLFDGDTMDKERRPVLRLAGDQ
jgi:hypothetical protein